VDKISYKTYKQMYPYICRDCGYLHWENRTICEKCGEEGTLREVNKQDYKIWRNERK